jgi:hypothetical protein
MLASDIRDAKYLHNFADPLDVDGQKVWNYFEVFRASHVAENIKHNFCADP